MRVYRDGRLLDACALASIALRAHGHFTSMQVRGGGVRGLSLHLDRLVDAERAMAGRSLDVRVVRDALRAALVADGRDDCSARVAILDGAGATAGAVHVAIGPPAEWPASPARLRGVVHQRRRPSHKHTGTLDLLEQRAAAMAAGFDDALFVGDDGLVREGSTWNLGLLRDGTLTWPLAPALRGTGERLLQAAWSSAGRHQVQRPVARADLGGFDGAFLVNARGVRAVAAIDGIRFDPAACGAAGIPQLVAAQPFERP